MTDIDHTKHKAATASYGAQNAAGPASPLLPGLERAAEICEADHRLYAHECAKFIRAEISCLKGEGSDHE